WCVAYEYYTIYNAVSQTSVAARRFPCQLKQAVPAPWQCCTCYKGVFFYGSENPAFVSVITARSRRRAPFWPAAPGRQGRRQDLRATVRGCHAADDLAEVRAGARAIPAQQLWGGAARLSSEQGALEYCHARRQHPWRWHPGDDRRFVPARRRWA